MSTNKFRRAYSLRIPRSPKTSTFVESSGIYDRLDEMEGQDDHHGQNEGSGNRDHSFSWEIPLITEPPKLHYCRRKWTSKSMRLPKTRQAEEEPTNEPEKIIQVGQKINVSNQENYDYRCSDGLKPAKDSQKHTEEQSEGEKQKGQKIKHYKKTIDRAFRRGWGTFISNIYTISLTRASQDSPHLVKAC